MDLLIKKCIIPSYGDECRFSHEPITLSMQLKSGFNLGTFNFTPIQNQDFHADGILGSALFNQYVVGIDFPNKKLFLLKY